MAKYRFRNHHSYEDDGTTIKSTYQDIEDTELNLGIPIDQKNRHYQQYLIWVGEGYPADSAS